ncbi:hypothetical protein ACJX0J_030226, partial [Zea mays]
MIFGNGLTRTFSLENVHLYGSICTTSFAVDETQHTKKKEIFYCANIISQIIITTFLIEQGTEHSVINLRSYVCIFFMEEYRL